MIQGRKKICLLICSALSGVKKTNLKDWLEQMPELSIVADIEPVFVFGQNSADITPEVWVKLATEISQRFNQFSGFVILHDVDNLLYTSSALSFLVQNITKSVIFTSSQIRESKRKQGLKANLINATQVAGYNLNEILLMFGNRLLRANQSVQHGEESFNIFTAPDNGILGRIDFSIRIFDKLALKNKGKIKSFDQLNTNIEIIDLRPVIDLKSLAKKITDRDGIIVNAGEYQNLPEDLIFLFEKVTKDIPVVIWSQKITAAVLAPKNIIVINNITWPATVTKLMWVLTQSKNINKIKELLTKDIAGEIIN